MQDILQWLSVMQVNACRVEQIASTIYSVEKKI